MKDYPQAQPVRLRYVESPNYEGVTFGKGLCDQLTSTAKKIVAVEFDVWGNWWHGLVGYEMLAIDGKKIVYVGGFNTNGVTGDPGPHPLADQFE